MTRAARLLFVRHGRTADNAAGRFQGQLGAGLDEVGREQAARVAAQLVLRAPAALYASDLQRARETAEILQATIGHEPRFDPRLREVDLGGWAGLTPAEVEARFPEEHAAWRAGTDVRRGGGETYEEAGLRVRAFAEEIASVHRSETLAVVSHGAALRAFVCLLLGLPANDDRIWGLRNAAVVEIAARPSGLALVSWNDGNPGS